MNKKGLKNKGFSLVELIIVIAIMAILTGVLAPNFMRYLERAREASDKQLLDNIRSVFAVMIIDSQSLDATGRRNLFRMDMDLAGGKCNTELVLWKLSTSPWRPEYDTPFGRAIAEQLGYSSVTAMKEGLPSEFKSSTADVEDRVINIKISAEGRVTVSMTPSTAEGGSIIVPEPSD